MEGSEDKAKETIKGINSSSSLRKESQNYLALPARNNKLNIKG